MATYDSISNLLKNTNFNSMTADKLATLLNTSSADTYDYTPRTDEELRTVAENKYNSLYNQKTLAAQQSYDTTANSIQNQLNALATSYNKNVRDTTANIKSALSSQSNSALKRGMGRSSYNLATMGGIQSSGVQTLADLLQSKSDSENELNSNLTLAAQQLAETLAGYQVDKESDILSYMDELRDTDYERQQTALANKQSALDTQNELIQWLANYAASNKSSSGSSGSYVPKTDNNNGNVTKEQTDAVYNSLKSVASAAANKVKSTLGSIKSSASGIDTSSLVKTGTTAAAAGLTAYELLQKALGKK